MTSGIQNPYKLPPLKTGMAEPIEKLNQSTPVVGPGVVSPPDKIAKAKLVSYVEASKNFNRIKRELKTETDKFKGKDTTKTPKEVKILGGIALAVLAFFGIKKFGPKVWTKIKSIFKK